MHSFKQYFKKKIVLQPKSEFLHLDQTNSKFVDKLRLFNLLSGIHPCLFNFLKYHQQPIFSHCNKLFFSSPCVLAAFFLIDFIYLFFHYNDLFCGRFHTHCIESFGWDKKTNSGSQRCKTLKPGDLMRACCFLCHSRTKVMFVATRGLNYTGLESHK